MAYGLEITTPDNYKVIDENNYVMVVAEKGDYLWYTHLTFW